jgi:hypothetical protein
MPYRWVNGPFVGASDTVQRAFGSDVVLSSEPLNKLAEKKSHYIQQSGTAVHYQPVHSRRISHYSTPQPVNTPAYTPPLGSRVRTTEPATHWLQQAELLYAVRCG